ncbi:hypothetical protein PC119_g24442 [Phytophthora cactorum]|nr:hypothetical protein PC119_g24442 [Phytophthora cactorum]
MFALSTKLVEIDKSLTVAVEERLQRGAHLEVNAVLALCERVKNLLVEDDNVMHVSSPVAVCGDIHGQFHDLLELFKVAGQAPDTGYVFPG